MRAFSRNSVLVCALIATAIAVPALAQQGSVSKYPDCPANFVPSPAAHEKARQVFALGKEADAAGDYDKAIGYFKDAFERECNATALLRDYIAKAYETKGDKVEAAAALEAYLAREPKADDVELVRKHIERLRAATTQPTVTTTTTTPTATTTATTTATATAVPTGTETAPTATGRSHTIGPWIVVIVGGAAAIAGAVMTGVGVTDISDSKSGCLITSDGKVDCTKLPPAQQTSKQSENTTGHTLESVGIIALAVGGAAIIGGLIWHFVEPTGPEHKTAIKPAVGPGYAGVSLEQRF